MVKPLINWPKNNVFVTVNNFEVIYEEYRNIFNFDNQYPSFKDLNSVQLLNIETALFTANYSTVSGYYVYKPGPELAAAYMYFVNKKHCLGNGNKRVSLAVMFGYLALNNKYLKTEWTKVYKVAKYIAKSKSKNKTFVIQKVTNFISQNLVDYNPNTEKEFKITVNHW